MSIETLLTRLRSHSALLVGLVVACVAAFKTRYLVLKSGADLTRSGILFDDAFFYTTLARNFVKLGFLTLDGETPTNGVQPLWQALLIAGHWSFPFWDLVSMNVAFSWVLYAAFCGSVSAWLWRVCEGKALPLALMACVGLVSAKFYGAILRGLETPLFLFTFSLWLWGTELLRVKRDKNMAREWHYAVLGLVCALLFLARTDWFVATVATFAWLCFTEKPISRVGVNMPSARRLAAFCLPLAAIVLPYVLHNWFVHGHPMPISGRVKLHYMKTALPTLEQYLKSQEWRGAFVLLRDVFRLGGKGNEVALRTWLLFGTAMAVGGAVFRSMPRARLWLGAVFVHWAFMQLAYRELRPYTSYYFAIEILTACVLMGVLLTWLIERIPALPKRTWVLSGAALVIALVWMTTDKPKSVKATARWDTRLRLALDLKKLPAKAKIGAFWPGVFAHYSERSVFPLDGIIGSQSYFEEVVKKQKEVEYAQKHDIDYIVAHFPLSELQKRSRPQTSNWDQTARQRLWPVCRNLRSTKYRRGRWSVFELTPEAVTPRRRCPGRR